MYARGCSQLWLPGDPMPSDLVDDVMHNLAIEKDPHSSRPADKLLETPDVFISFRFGEAHTEALALKAALEALQLKVFLSDVSPGGNMQHVIAHALSTCKRAIILATNTYGRRTNALFCTSAEMNYIIGQNKAYYLVRMIPFGQSWAEPTTMMAFPPSTDCKVCPLNPTLSEQRPPVPHVYVCPWVLAVVAARRPDSG